MKNARGIHVKVELFEFDFHALLSFDATTLCRKTTFFVQVFLPRQKIKVWPLGVVCLESFTYINDSLCIHLHMWYVNLVWKMMCKWGHLHTKFHTKISLKVIHTPLAKKGDNTLYTQWLHYCEAHQPSSFFLILMCSIFVTSKLLKLIILNLQRFWVTFGKDLTYKSDFLHFCGF